MLRSEVRKPGVYAISPSIEAGKAWIGALVTSGSGDECSLDLTVAAVDGEVEVLADDDHWIASAPAMCPPAAGVDPLAGLDGGERPA